MMSCKLTVGEVRDTYKGRRRVVSTAWPWSLAFGCEHGIYARTRIVEVAPKNRARVTAGPTWMSAR